MYCWVFTWHCTNLSLSCESTFILCVHVCTVYYALVCTTLCVCTLFTLTMLRAKNVNWLYMWLLPLIASIVIEEATELPGSGQKWSMKWRSLIETLHTYWSSIIDFYRLVFRIMALTWTTEFWLVLPLIRISGWTLTIDGGVLSLDSLSKVNMKRGTNVVDIWPFKILRVA